MAVSANVIHEVRTDGNRSANRQDRRAGRSHLSGGRTHNRDSAVDHHHHGEADAVQSGLRSDASAVTTKSRAEHGSK